MKRFAAHYILYPEGNLRKLHYIELDDRNCIRTIEPLNAEIAATAFYNGIIVVSNEDVPDKPVKLYLLSGVDLLAPKFSASDCGSNCHIQRLC
jgi:hypothetical protein